MTTFVPANDQQRIICQHNLGDGASEGASDCLSVDYVVDNGKGDDGIGENYVNGYEFDHFENYENSNERVVDDEDPRTIVEMLREFKVKFPTIPLATIGSIANILRKLGHNVPTDSRNYL